MKNLDSQGPNELKITFHNLPRICTAKESCSMARVKRKTAKPTAKGRVRPSFYSRARPQQVASWGRPTNQSKPDAKARRIQAISSRQNSGLAAAASPKEERTNTQRHKLQLESEGLPPKGTLFGICQSPCYAGRHSKGYTAFTSVLSRAQVQKLAQPHKPITPCSATGQSRT